MCQSFNLLYLRLNIQTFFKIPGNRYSFSRQSLFILQAIAIHFPGNRYSFSRQSLFILQAIAIHFPGNRYSFSRQSLFIFQAIAIHFPGNRYSFSRQSLFIFQAIAIHFPGNRYSFIKKTFFHVKKKKRVDLNVFLFPKWFFVQLAIPSYQLSAFWIPFDDLFENDISQSNIFKKSRFWWNRQLRLLENCWSFNTQKKVHPNPTKITLTHRSSTMHNWASHLWQKIQVSPHHLRFISDI